MCGALVKEFNAKSKKGARCAFFVALQDDAPGRAVCTMLLDTDCRLLRRLLLGLTQTDVQFLELTLVDRARRLREQTLRALRLRERDHVADRVGAGHHRDDAVQTERDTAVRRRAVLQRVQQEAELRTRFFRTDLQRAEHLALHVFLIDTDRTAADFPAIQHHVVSLREAAARVRFQIFQVLVLRARERVMRGHVAVFFLVVLEHREVDHPQRLPALLDQTVGLAEFRMADLQTQRAQAVVHDLRAVCCEEDDVAVLCAGALQDGGDRRVVQVLDDRALQTVTALRDFVDLDPGQTLRAVDAHEFRVAVDVATRKFSALRHAQCGHAAVLAVGRRAEHLEVHVLHGVRQFREFELHAQVGLVRTEAAHGFRVRHDRELRVEFDADRFLEHVTRHIFEQVTDFLLAEERRFAVDLREFRLTVCAQIFVAEALDDLVVAIEVRDHQHLLEELRRLRQREELTRVHARRHEVVARAFRRALREHRRFDVDEAERVEILAHGHRHAVTQTQVVLHLRTAQVEHAMREARGFREVVVVELERRRDRRVQHHDFVAQHFDLAAREVGVDRAFRTIADQTLDLHAELVAHAFGDLEHLGAIRVADDLNEAFAVAQVDEDNAAVVAAALHPSAQRNSLAQQLFGHQTAVFRSHRHDVRLSLCVN
ncbi:conserved hypothetical protein [Paraburkholderia tropica]